MSISSAAKLVTEAIEIIQSAAKGANFSLMVRDDITGQIMPIEHFLESLNAFKQ